ncbi:Diphthamide biosynthesis protein 2 [Agyrium rufum]|nr:Diphthamide biosynthesis protein 2 [Agyrium rufum]
MTGSGSLQAAPVLFTPDTHIFETPTPLSSNTMSRTRRTNEQLFQIYEIDRTLREIQSGKWKRIALQFPDQMLPDAPRVFEILQERLRESMPSPLKPVEIPTAPQEKEISAPAEDEKPIDVRLKELNLKASLDTMPRLYILGDTSYGACCVDEIAAEHVDADVVVHYGRACLSPTARLPVIHVFTHQPLALEAVLSAFGETYPDYVEKVILMADVTYSSHVEELKAMIRGLGYENVFVPRILSSPSSPIPNRTVPLEVEQDASILSQWRLFHISEPPQSLLLTLSSRLSAIHIFPTTSDSSGKQLASSSLVTNTTLSLRRRYALVTKLTTVSIFGILINTLSVKNYMHLVSHVQTAIRAAGKKSYTFVVGKVNAAKIANFSEIDGWVVIGCWESSLVENSEFWKPVITPFELELVLKGDRERVWTGTWRGDWEGLLPEEKTPNVRNNKGAGREDVTDAPYPIDEDDVGSRDMDSEPESAPPEFDFRTGRYVASSQILEPKQTNGGRNGTVDGACTNAVARRAKGDVAIIGTEISPAAEFLRERRTWKGLGSDFVIAYDESGNEAGAVIEEGRSGIARGYEDKTTSMKR